MFRNFPRQLMIVATTTLAQHGHEVQQHNPYIIEGWKRGLIIWLWKRQNYCTVEKTLKCDENHKLLNILLSFTTISSLLNQYCTHNSYHHTLTPARSLKTDNWWKRKLALSSENRSTSSNSSNTRYNCVWCILTNNQTITADDGYGTRKRGKGTNLSEKDVARRVAWALANNN